jgi:hypothetical protein
MDAPEQNEPLITLTIEGEGVHTWREERRAVGGGGRGDDGGDSAWDSQRQPLPTGGGPCVAQGRIRAPLAQRGRQRRRPSEGIGAHGMFGLREPVVLS